MEGGSTSLGLWLTRQNHLFTYMHCYILSYLQDAQKECHLVNAPLICRAASRVPFSVLKYAMTLDGMEFCSFSLFCPLLNEFEYRTSKLHYTSGYICLSHYLPFVSTGKIAASTGHSWWISSKLSRNLVYELRGRCDAVIVGGNTIRRDSEYHHYYLYKFLRI